MENTQKIVYIIWDTKTKSLLSIFDDEKKQLEYLKNLVLNDIQVEKTNLKMKILETNDRDEAQKLEMILEQLKQQENLKDLKRYSYIKDDKVIQRYFIYMKPMNDTKTKIFLN
jgi:hypothetical protein